MKRQPWTENEVQLLRNMVEDGCSDRIIFEQDLKRPFQLIKQKANQIGLDLSYLPNAPRGRKSTTSVPEKPANETLQQNDRVSPPPIFARLKAFIKNFEHREDRDRSGLVFKEALRGAL